MFAGRGSGRHGGPSHVAIRKIDIRFHRRIPARV
jgi:hypothetical protein